MSLVSEVAEERPLLCVVDDAQWLDQASALTLAFVARRLLAEPVGLVFAAREPGEQLQHVPDLEVRGLVNGDARALLDSTVRFALDGRVRDRILAETRGNPLALLELPRGLTPTQLAGGFGMPDAHDLSKRIEKSYPRRLSRSRGTRDALLLVAAAEPVGDPLLLQRACDRLGIAPSAIDATDGLLAVEERVTFRHPLARSAVYRSAGGPERRAAHLALAKVTDRDVDPDRRAWHLAAAAAEPDEDGRARAGAFGRTGRKARGGFRPPRPRSSERAVALTADPARRADRALAATQASLRAGAFDVARGLLATAEAGPLDELGRARMDLLQAEVVFAQRRGSDAPLLLLQAAKKLEPLDVRLARDTYLEAWGAALFAGHLASAGGSLLDVSRAVATAPDRRIPRFPATCCSTASRSIFTDGRPAAAPVLGAPSPRSASAEVSAEEVLRWGCLATRAANLALGLRPRLEIAHARGRTRPRLRGARGPRRRRQRVRSGRRVRRRLRESPRC